MSSYLNGFKAANHRTSLVGMGAGSDAKVAAKAADINAFTDIMREKKRLNERANEQQAELSTANQGQPVPTVSFPVNVDQMVAQHLRASPDNAVQLASVSTANERALSLSLNSEGAEGTASMNSSKVIESIVTVVQRMIDNHATSADPKKWDIQLGIDGSPVMELSVIHLGGDEWRIEFFDDQNSRQHEAESSDFNSIVSNIEKLLPELEAAFQKSRPDLRLSAAVVTRSDA